MQADHEVTRGELTGLIGVEDLRPAATAEGRLQSLQAKLRVKTTGELPAKNMPGVEINDRHQVEWGYPNSVDSSQGLTGLSLRVLTNCCS
jgi:hypothetical protein